MSNSNDASLVTADWLEKNLTLSSLRIVDVREDGVTRQEGSGPRICPTSGPRFRSGLSGARPSPRPTSSPYEQGHIPGSLRLDVARTLFDIDGGLVSLPEFAIAMSEIGIGDDHTIVLVDESFPGIALVAVWAFAHYGHSRVHVLSGGFPRWKAEKRAVTRAAVRYPYASFTARAS